MPTCKNEDVETLTEILAEIPAYADRIERVPIAERVASIVDVEHRIPEWHLCPKFVIAARGQRVDNLQSAWSQLTPSIPAPSRAERAEGSWTSTLARCRSATFSDGA
jgi:hypothetical protein